jgi:hypothetical protein
MLEHGPLALGAGMQGGGASGREDVRVRERRRHAARMGATAHTPFLRHMGGMTENGEMVCVLCWRRYLCLQCHFFLLILSNRHPVGDSLMKDPPL